MQKTACSLLGALSLLATLSAVGCGGGGGAPGGGAGSGGVTGAAGAGGDAGGAGTGAGGTGPGAGGTGTGAGGAGPGGSGAASTPVELAAGLTSNGVIEANATHVYFENRGSVNRVPVAGGAMERIIEGNQGVASIALDDTTLFVLDNGGFTVTNGVIKSLAFASIPGTHTPVIMNQSDVSTLIAAGDDLVWISSTVAATTIKSIPKGSAAGTVPVAVANLGNQAWFGGLASVGANVYFGSRIAQKSGVSSAARAGGGIQTILLMDQEPHILSFTADADGVYFTTGSGGNQNALDGKLWKAPLAGGAPTMLASGINEPGRLIADGANVYWLDAGAYDNTYKQGSINKVPKAGGAPTIVASGVDGLARTAYSIAGGAVFYVTAATATPANGQLFKVAK